MDTDASAEPVMKRRRRSRKTSDEGVVDVESQAEGGAEQVQEDDAGQSQSEDDAEQSQAEDDAGQSQVAECDAGKSQESECRDAGQSQAAERDARQSQAAEEVMRKKTTVDKGVAVTDEAKLIRKTQFTLPGEFYDSHSDLFTTGKKALTVECHMCSRPIINPSHLIYILNN